MAELNSETTVADLVTEKPGRSRFFENLGIDYCCGGKRPIGEVCAERGLDVRTLLDTLAAVEAAGEAGPSDPDWELKGASPAELARHIVEVHHAFLRRELPRLSELGAHVAGHHGEREPRLERVTLLLASLRRELEAHLATEERELFPAIVTGGELEPGAEGLLSALEGEHESAGLLLREIRGLTDGYRVPEWGCNSFRAFYDGLEELEIDIHQHVHEENNILFPALQEASGNGPAGAGGERGEGR